MKILPFTDENLRAALPTPKKPRAQCSVCSSIGPYVGHVQRADDPPPEPFPAALSQLSEFMRLGENVATNWLERCPECDGLWYAERSYEYLVTGSEDSESYQQIDADGVLALAEVSWARKPGTELHHLDDGTWAIITEPGKNRPQRRS